MHSSVLQGSVLSPTLFLIFIDDIVDQLPITTDSSLFADDLSIWIAKPSVEMATKQLQQALDTVTQWSLQWKMTLSAEKSEVILFTNDNHQAKLQPTLRLNNTVLPYNPSPTFLGVTLDRDSILSPTRQQGERQNEKEKPDHKDTIRYIFGR